MAKNINFSIPPNSAIVDSQDVFIRTGVQIIGAMKEPNFEYEPLRVLVFLNLSVTSTESTYLC